MAEGNIDKEKNIFFAKRVLAKHDENYMPPEIEKNDRKLKCFTELGHIF